MTTVSSSPNAPSSASADAPDAAAAHLYEATDFDPNRGDRIPDHLDDLIDEDESALATVREAKQEGLALLGWRDEFDEVVAEADSVEGVFAAFARTVRTFTAWGARGGCIRSSPALAAPQSTAEPHRRMHS